MPDAHPGGRGRRFLSLLAITGLAVGAMSLLQPHLRTTSGRGHHATPPSAQSLAEGVETTDISPKAVVMILGSLMLTTILVIIIVLVMGWRFHVNSRIADRALTPEQTAQEIPLAPRLQMNPFGDISALRDHEDHMLNSYEWLDAGHTLARIPIGRARAVVVGRSLDASP